MVGASAPHAMWLASWPLACLAVPDCFCGVGRDSVRVSSVCQGGVPGKAPCRRRGPCDLHLHMCPMRPNIASASEGVCRLPDDRFARKI